MKEECSLKGLSVEKLPGLSSLNQCIILGSPVSITQHKTKNCSPKKLSNLTEKESGNYNVVMTFHIGSSFELLHMICKK